MTGALAIFAKTPGLSPVKTRLATAIGVKKAEEFYQHSAKCVEELALDASRMSEGSLVPYWAVGEQNGHDHPLWMNMNRLWTGRGDLGDRLHHVYATLLQQHDHVILIGTDSPQLPVSAVLTAHEHLKRKTGPVIGPADDGGYTLFGGHVPLPQALWTSVTYSVSTTCADFAKKLKPYGPILFLEQSYDIDILDDVTKLRNDEARMIGKAQKALLAWIEQNVTFRAHPANEYEVVD
ncbi:MAG: DUF2064 domain-containing protein [Alphaproteobacteria bacterium]|nr:DUF2064 domain-containing protein [Alphaproteobacteria bacterium]